MNEKQSKTMRCLLGASVMGAALSVCLCVGSTFAWFQHTVSNENVIEIGTFGTNATMALTQTRSIAQVSSAATVFPPGFYDLSIRGVGNTPGYARIFLDAVNSDFRSDTYYTKQLSGKSAYTFQIMLHEPTAIRVVPVWGRMDGESPLDEEEIIWYGRPPIVEKPKEDESQQENDAEVIPPAEGTDSAPTPGNGEGTPPADDGESTPPTGSGDSTPPASGGESTPSTGGGDSTPSTGNGDNTPPASGGESTPSTGGGDSTPSISVGESTPPASGGESTPSTGGGDSTPSTGNGDNTPPTGSGESTPSTSSGDSTPPTGSGESTPSTG
ncbi:MAG: hypothetical protein E7440_07960, partial [Ruminococcaceae bacterium]|nr:hypothetical protein [Oscillospiraceae bacterium]